ncbi:hypothetical protein BC828DRAFT_380799 [Blastocladiella britannica]|nr:hypothetical protein BC828DRAFT_380799 [Blastocladiella britannica]
MDNHGQGHGRGHEDFPPAHALPPLPMSPTHASAAFFPPSLVPISAPVPPATAPEPVQVPEPTPVTVTPAQSVPASHEQTEAQAQAAARAAAAQLEQRLAKAVALLVRYARDVTAPVPAAMPAFLARGIDDLRAVADHERATWQAQTASDTALWSATRASLEHERSALRSSLASAQAALAETTRAREIERAQAAAAVNAAVQEASDAEAAAADLVRDARHERDHWRREAERLAGEAARAAADAATLQVALEASASAARADAEMRAAGWTRKLATATAAADADRSACLKLQDRVRELEDTVRGKAAAVKELQGEVHALTHHIQHKLSTAAANAEVDRTLVANLVVQFVTQPPVRRWEILPPLAALLNLSADQRVAVGLDRAPPATASSVTSSASLHAPGGGGSSDVVDPLAAAKRAGTGSGPDTNGAGTTSTGGQFQQSLSEKFISFLMRESTVPDQDQGQQDRTPQK